MQPQKCVFGKNWVEILLGQKKPVIAKGPFAVGESF